MLDTRPSFRPCRLRVDPRVYWLASRPVSQRNVTSLRGFWGQSPLHAPCASSASPDSTRGEIAHQCDYTAREPRHSSAKPTTQASRPSRYICSCGMNASRCLIGLTSGHYRRPPMECVAFLVAVHPRLLTLPNALPLGAYNSSAVLSCYCRNCFNSTSWLMAWWWPTYPVLRFLGGQAGRAAPASDQTEHWDDIQLLRAAQLRASTSVPKDLETLETQRIPCTGVVEKQCAVMRCAMPLIRDRSLSQPSLQDSCAYRVAALWLPLRCADVGACWRRYPSPRSALR